MKQINNTSSLIVGKRYVIEGLECQITFNGKEGNVSCFRADILSGENKGRQFMDLHSVSHLKITEL